MAHLLNKLIVGSSSPGRCSNSLTITVSHLTRLKRIHKAVALEAQEPHPIFSDAYILE